MALLLSNFGSSSLSAPAADNDTNKIAEAFNRISRFNAWVKRSILNFLKMLRAKISNQIADQTGHPGNGCGNLSWKQGSYHFKKQRHFVFINYCFLFFILFIFAEQFFNLFFFYFWVFIFVHDRYLWLFHAPPSLSLWKE